MSVERRLGWRIGATLLLVTVLCACALPVVEEVDRPSLARLSGSSGYREYRSSWTINPALLRKATTPRTVEEFHTAGINAIRGRESGRAVHLLQQAARLADALPARRKAEILNDLAVAHYEHGRSANPKHLILGLDAAQQAWSLDLTWTTAWTRAVLLESVVGPKLASDAWSNYLQLDPTSAWADEVRRRPPLPTVNANPRAVQEKLFRNWAEAVLTRRIDDEARALMELKRESKRREALSGDRFLVDTVTWLQSLGFLNTRKKAAKAILLRISGAIAFSQRDVNRAEPRLRESRERLQALQSPLSFDVTVRLANVLQERARFDDAMTLLQANAEVCAPRRRYFAVCAMQNWSTGVVELARGQESVALARLDLALAEAERTSNKDWAAAILRLRAVTLDAMHTGDEAWRDRMRAMQLYSVALGRPDFTLYDIAVAAVRDDYVHAAAALFTLAVRDAERRQDVHAVTRLSRWPAFARARIDGDRSDPNLYFAREGYVSTASGIVRAKASFASGRRDAVVGALIGRQTEFLPPRSDWTEMVQELTSEFMQREAMGILVAENVRRLYEGESHSEINRGSVLSALWMSDRARLVGVPWKKTLCTGDGSGAGAAENGRKLVACVPHAVTMVHQDLQDEWLHTWVFRDGRADLTTTWVPVPQLLAEIRQFQQSIARNDDPVSLRAQARHLYDLLLGPVQQKIAGGGLLVYSPSADLRGVPVTALHDGTRFLIEARPVATTLTVSAFEIPQMPAKSASALVVLPEAALSRNVLDGARSEVRAVARLYENRSMLLFEAAATPKKFLDSAAAHDLIHVATHGETGARPYQNSIEFGQERIRAYDVFTLDLTRKPIVMLASCRTADSTGGPMNVSLSDAFLAAGASSVIGSLWDVEDRATAQLSVAFHRELARGATPHDALRTVQLQFIRQGMPMSAWAAFQVSS
jgi:CHAT domain-containing protein